MAGLSLAWWVAVVMDHFSRRAIGSTVFRSQPTSLQVQGFLDRAIVLARQEPRYIVCDKGTQFWCGTFKSWCKARRIRPRFGAVGKYGSIAVIERFFRSMKSVCTRCISVPLGLREIREELALYSTWYNGIRPHQALAGRTP